MCYFHGHGAANAPHAAANFAGIVVVLAVVVVGSGVVVVVEVAGGPSVEVGDVSLSFVTLVFSESTL